MSYMEFPTDRDEPCLYDNLMFITLFLEVHIHIDLTELPCYLDNIEGVSGKSTYGFYDNHVNLALVAETEHFIEFITLFHVRSRNTFVGKYTHKRPFRLGAYAFLVMGTLYFVAV